MTCTFVYRTQMDCSASANCAEARSPRANSDQSFSALRMDAMVMASILIILIILALVLSLRLSLLALVSLILAVEISDDAHKSRQVP